jgi:phenylalanyl-tRNA synthetase beta chain
MKFPYSMLRDFVETRLNADQIGAILTMAGFELEGVEDIDGEPVLDIKVMSNRGDGLSVFGLAREVLAKDTESRATDLYRSAVAGFSEAAGPSSLDLSAEAATIDSPDCLRFACRGFENVDAKGSSPEWMQKRMGEAGMRPISILVDLTNYVMLELGQPLHAFDRDKLVDGRIVVRHAEPGEKLTTLNGIEHELNGQMMICDAEKPVGVPGVMGGLETEVTDSTTTLLLESANFRNTTVRKTRKQLGLNTEASYRFERSVDPDGVVRAIERFTELLVASQPGIRFSNVVDIYPGKSSLAPIELRLNRANRLLGMEIDAVSAERYLRNLGFELTTTHQPETTFHITPPSWRPDIVREIDLVEELGRVHGYERIPEELPIGHTPSGGVHGPLLKVDLLRSSLVTAGLVQTISHSLRDRHPLDASTERIGPKNPASPDMALLRNSILPSLADAAVRNGGKDIHIFEVGVVFSGCNGKYFEAKELGVLSTGILQPPGWQSSGSGQADLFSLKGTIEAVLSASGYAITFEARDGADGRFHPTRFASIEAGGESVGYLGQIHPAIAEACKLPEGTCLACIDLESLIQNAERPIGYRAISRNPSVRRDLSIELSKSIPFTDVEGAVAAACGEVLEKQWLFDVYEGKGIAEGNHSLSIALQLRKHGENFTDEEANQVRERVVAALVALGAKPR